VLRWLCVHLAHGTYITMDVTRKIEICLDARLLARRRAEAGFLHDWQSRNSR
jgi:hypothetical protein